MLLKAISDSLQTNLKSSNSGCKKAIGENWEKNGGRNVSKIYVAIRTNDATWYSLRKDPQNPICDNMSMELSWYLECCFPMNAYKLVI